jgi:hypothetical protein
MPSFEGEVKLFVPCRRYAACKRKLRFTWKLESAGKIDRPCLAPFRPSLREVSHVAWRGAPLEMTDGTKGGAQIASSLRRWTRHRDPYLSVSIYPKHMVEALCYVIVYIWRWFGAKLCAVKPKLKQHGIHLWRTVSLFTVTLRAWYQKSM